MSTLRHRDLLLSLKYSTIEACFSVPMLNLTMPNMSFPLAFAVTALGWPPWAIGFMAALPHLCNFAQPPLSLVLERLFALRRMIQIGFLLNALPWLIIGGFLVRGSLDNKAFAALLTISTLASSLASVAWSASISEIVPARISGIFYGRRNLVFGFWTLLAVLAAGKIVDLQDNSLEVFGWIFVAASLGRLIGLSYLNRMKFPAAVTERKVGKVDWRAYLEVFKDWNYLVFAIFTGLWGLLLNMALPFYTAFLIRGLEQPVGFTISLTTVAGLGGLITLRAWGRLSDRFGSQPVLTVCAILWALVAAVSWIMANEGFYHHLYLTYLVVGGTTAGFQLCQFNLMIKLIPGARRAPHIAVFLAVSSLLTALGPLAGGLVLSALPPVLGNFMGHPLRSYHVLFAISHVACLLTPYLLYQVREREASAPEDVWRTLPKMKAFNPLLVLTNAAQFVATPRGLLSLAGQSYRSLRRQARRVAEVGEDMTSTVLDTFDDRPPRK